jgi:DNA-binding CsgD family transcriptional regulator
VPDADHVPRVSVVVGVDGAGRTHRLTQLADELGVTLARPTAATVHAVLAADGPLLVDDAHRLAPEVLAALTDAALGGRHIVVTRRPTLTGPELAALDDALAATGATERLPEADADDDAGNLPGWRGDETAVTARAQRRLALLDAASAQVMRVLALDLGLAREALAAAAHVDAGELAPAFRAAYEAGFTDAGERLVPAVRRGILAGLSPTEQRTLLDAAARGVVAAGLDPAPVAQRLRETGARSATAAAVYRATGHALRLTDPVAAAGWLDDALDAGDDPARQAADRAEIAALLGEPVEPPEAPDAEDAGRVAIALGAAAAAAGRPGRAVEHLRAAGPDGTHLAAAIAWTAGLVTHPDGAVQPWLARFTEASAATARDPQAALPGLIEAAEGLRGTTIPLPDTPHAVAAVAAVADADAATAERLLERALAPKLLGPVMTTRHRLLLAWVRLRAGRYDTATAVLKETRDAALPGRERLLRTALQAGLARRSGDVAAMREVWPAVQEHLARRAVDLLAVELVEELAVTAARLRQRRNTEALLAALDAAAAGLDPHTPWRVPLAWTRLQVAAATDDADDAAAAAAAFDDLTITGAGPRHAAMLEAGRQWSAVLRGDVDEERVTDVAATLAGVQLPWEASRLVGQAGVRTTDPAVARRLLEKARDLAGAEPPTAAAPSGPAAAGLSEREVEVSRLVLAGRTHREIGAQLYIAPKTVEHHVARIRAKLGATTRAEFIASLRHVLAEPGDGDASGR